MSKKYINFSIAAVLSVIADQWSKVWARSALATGDRVIIPNYWDFTLAQNKGTAFSLFRDLQYGRYVLLIASLVALPIIVAFLRKTEAARWRMHVELGLIFGGALGNIIDRAMYGSVTDFIVWKYKNHPWPTFNVADAALVIGVIGLFFEPQKKAESKAT